MKLIDLYNEIKVTEPNPYPAKIIQLYDDILESLRNMEDGFAAQNYDVNLADIILDTFLGHSRDDLFPEGWFDLIEKLDISYQKVFYNRLMKLKNNLDT